MAVSYQRVAIFLCRLLVLFYPYIQINGRQLVNIS